MKKRGRTIEIAYPIAKSITLLSRKELRGREKEKEKEREREREGAGSVDDSREENHPVLDRS